MPFYTLVSALSTLTIGYIVWGIGIQHRKVLAYSTVSNQIPINTVQSEYTTEGIYDNKYKSISYSGWAISVSLTVFTSQVYLGIVRYLTACFCDLVLVSPVM